MAEYVRGKYNNGASIDISSIPEDELKVAIKDWSQGYKSMEDFLWKCYNNGLETFGTNMGPLTYVDFNLEGSKKSQLCKMICATLKETNSSISFSHGVVNPLSSDSMDMHRIGVLKLECSKDESNQFINNLSAIIESGEEPPEEKLAEDIFELASFFIDKKSDIHSFMIESLDDGKYNFIIRPSQYLLFSRKLDTFFSNLGMVPSFSRSFRLIGWEIPSDNVQDLMAKVRTIKESFLENQSECLELPKKIEDGMEFYTIYNIKKSRFGDSVQGKQKLQEWLDKARELFEKCGNNNSFKDYFDWLYSEEEPENALSKSIEEMTGYGDTTMSQVTNGGAMLGEDKNIEDREDDSELKKQ